MDFLLPLWLWLSYFFVWITLFWLNFHVFKKYSWLEVEKEILQDQNTSLASIIRWQLIGQSIMIGSLIYFFGTTLEKIVSNGVIVWEKFAYNILDLAVFGMIGIILFQATIYVVGKFISLEKEILVDQNDAVWKMIEWLLIAMSILLSLSIYSY